MDEQAAIRRAMRQRRRTLGLSQHETATLLGMSRLIYHRVETGARRIRFTELVAIGALFNLRAADLVGDEGIGAALMTLHFRGTTELLQRTIPASTALGPVG
jgi:transcriptional regulator with XRE-family HTH domain